MFELHPDAVIEAWEARRHYSEIDPDLGERFYRAVDAARRRIAAAPERWPTHLHGTRHLLVRGFPYRLVYVIEGGTVVLLAVAHAKRRPGYWRKRLEN